MLFTDEDLLKFKNFCQSIIEKPRAIIAQPHVRESGFLWCDDWRIIEILKYFFNGRDMYINDPPPNRLKNNPLWSKDVIMSQAEELLAVYMTVDDIVHHLKSEREKAYA